MAEEPSSATPPLRQRIPACLLLMVALLYILDQVSKWLIVLKFELPQPYWLDRVSVIAGSSIMNFDIVRLHNNGVAFGAGSGTAWAPYVFLSIQVIALVWLVWLFRRGLFSTRLLKLAWGFIMVGVIGNMTDRLLQGFFLPGAGELTFWQNLSNGYVVDFLDFSFPWLVLEGWPRGYHWPSFNVADSCVCIAAALFVIASIITPSGDKKSESKGGGEDKGGDTPPEA